MPRKAKVALGCWYYKKLLKTLKVAQKLPSTIYLCLVGGLDNMSDKILLSYFSEPQHFTLLRNWKTEFKVEDSV